MTLLIAHKDSVRVDSAEVSKRDSGNNVREEFRFFSRDADTQEGEAVREPGAPTARTAPNQIGEAVEWSQVKLFDGRDVLTVMRLV